MSIDWAFSYERLRKDCEKLLPVSGRMEVMEVGGFTIWIDYAHTAAAVEELLVFANSVKKRKDSDHLGVWRRTGSHQASCHGCHCRKIQ